MVNRACVVEEGGAISHIFISYASDDRERVIPLVEALEAEGWRVWWDRTILPGKTYDVVIENALDSAGCVIAVWTESSIGSRWVKIEANEGLNRGVLVPVLLDDVDPPLGFRAIQLADLRDWEPGAPSAGFRILVDAVHEFIPLEGSERTRGSDDGDRFDTQVGGTLAEVTDRQSTSNRQDLTSEDGRTSERRKPAFGLWWIAAAGVLAVLTVALVVAGLNGGSSTAQTDASSTTVAGAASTAASVASPTTASIAPSTAATDVASVADPAAPQLLEVEDGILAEPMAVHADANASGNVYVSSPEGGIESDELGGSVTLEFAIEQPGVYEIWGHVSQDEANPSGSDSMFVKLDDRPEDVWDFFEQDPSSVGWAWDRISLRCGGTFEEHRCDPWLVDLVAGEHVITLRNREPNPRLDALWIVQHGTPDTPPVIVP
jgi:hypothetical protein